MEETRGDLYARFDELSRTVEELRRRLTALESNAAPALAPASAMAALPYERGPAEAPSATQDEELQPESLIPALGWALLGIAGAYLLRSVSSSSAIAGLLGTGAGVIYAGGWLVFASRRAADRPLHSGVFAMTAAMILAPMLWETTVRLRLLPVESASSVLVAFVLLGLTISWKRNVASIASIVTLTALGVGIALFRETHNTLALVVTILVVAAAVEFSACRDRWLRLRWIVAGVADLTVLLVTVMSTTEASAGAGNPSNPVVVLSAQIALLTIYLSSTVDRTIFRKLPIIRFEIGQAAVAFLISIGGALRLAEIHHAAAAGVGWFCMTGAAACYLVSFAFLDRAPERDRNFYTYSTFAILLALAGCWVLLTGTLLAGVWSLLAAVAVCAAFVRDRGTLRLHSATYLILAVVTAELVPQAMGRITGTSAQAGDLPSNGYLLSLAGCVLCYLALLLLGRRAEPHWADRIEATLSAALSCLAIAGLAASAIYRYVSPAAPLRTALITAFALGAAWGGLHWRRRELKWLAYPLMALAGFKLLAEDFQQGRSLTLFVSLIFFGGGLILLPRLLRQKAAPSAAGG